MADETGRGNHARVVAQAYIRKYDIQDPPTPIHQMIEAEGLTIAPMRWGTDSPLDGLLVCNKRVIALNMDKPPRRQRFSLAHELGHYALNHNYLKQLEPAIDLDHPPARVHPAHDPFEAEANEFANELLVPLQLLKRFRPAPEQEKDGSGQGFHRPFANLAKRMNKPRVLKEQDLANLFEVSAEVIFIALTRHKLL